MSGPYDDLERRAEDAARSEDRARITALWRWLVLEMRVDSLSVEERQAHPLMVRAYLTGVDHGKSASRRRQHLVTFAMFVGPLVAVMVDHLWPAAR